MSTNQKTTSKSLKIGEQTIDPRITIGDVRRLKSQHGVDLANTDDDSVGANLILDPMALADLAFKLYEKQLAPAGIDTQEKFEEFLDSETITTLQEVVTEAIAGFFPVQKIVFTKMREFQRGDLDLEEVDKLIEMGAKNKVIKSKASGSSSSRSKQRSVSA